MFQDTSHDTGSKSGNSKSPKQNKKSMLSCESIDSLCTKSMKSRTHILSDLLDSSVFLQHGSSSSTDISPQPASSCGGDESDTSRSSDEAVVCPMNAKGGHDNQWCNANASRSSFVVIMKVDSHSFSHFIKFSQLLFVYSKFFCGCSLVIFLPLMCREIGQHFMFKCNYVSAL